MSASVQNALVSLEEFLGQLPKLNTVDNYENIDQETIETWLAQHQMSSSVFELASKNLIHKIITSDQYETDYLVSLLDISLLTNQYKSINTLLIEEVFELQTTDWIHTFFTYLLRREKLIMSNTFLLRLCNSLLRRNRDPKFAGIIVCFLARVFPLSEKSGLNIRGSYNVDNVTFYDQEESDSKSEDVNQKEKDLYVKFWGLQDVFREPVKLLSGDIEQFKNTVSEVITELKKRESSNGRKTESFDTVEDELDDQFVPKWLTHRDLFELQLNDYSFRRTILTQFMILFNFLSKAGSNPNVSNQSVNYKKFTDEAFLTSTLKDVQKTNYNSLDLEPAFLRTLKTVIQRDGYWQSWKQKGCPQFIAPPLPESEVEAASEKLKNVLMKPRKPFWHKMGTPGLSKIWKIQTGIESLKDKKRYQIPDARSYFDRAKEERQKLANVSETPDGEDKEEQGMDAKNRIESLTWRGMRAARAQGLWTQFNLVTEKTGFGGLYGESDYPPEESNTPDTESDVSKKRPLSAVSDEEVSEERPSSKMKLDEKSQEPEEVKSEINISEPLDNSPNNNQVQALEKNIDQDEEPEQPLTLVSTPAETEEPSNKDEDMKDGTPVNDAETEQA